MTDELVSIGGGRRNVARGGDGPPLVLWHGVGRRWQDFAPLLPSLTARWGVVAVDHRGHGRSDRADSYLVRDYAADAAELLPEVVSEPAVLVGHSLGALVALAVAAERPELVRAVVLEDPPAAAFLARVGETNYAATWAAMRANAGRSDLSAVAAELARVRLPDGRTLGQVRDAAALWFLARCLADLDPDVLGPPLAGGWLDGFDVIGTARRVRCPALLLAAGPADGGGVPAADADALAAALPDGGRIDFPGRGHLLHADHPDAVLRVIVPFLESVRP